FTASRVRGVGVRRRRFVSGVLVVCANQTAPTHVVVELLLNGGAAIIERRHRRATCLSIGMLVRFDVAVRRPRLSFCVSICCATSPLAESAAKALVSRTTNNFERCVCIQTDRSVSGW